MMTRKLDVMDPCHICASFFCLCRLGKKSVDFPVRSSAFWKATLHQICQLSDTAEGSVSFLEDLMYFLARLRSVTDAARQEQP